MGAGAVNFAILDEDSGLHNSPKQEPKKNPRFRQAQAGHSAMGASGKESLSFNKETEKNVHPL